jgi:predicted Fe-Mo cluster-binding NifX family protein
MMTYKIAAVTEDGEKISSHFGMASAYQIFTVVDDQILDETQRPKPHHTHHPQHEGQHDGHSGNHDDMFAPVTDCQVLLCGGMGEPAYQRALAAGLKVVLAGGDIRMTVDAYLKGDLSSDMRRVHRH